MIMSKLLYPIKYLLVKGDEWLARRDGWENYECDIDTGICYITDNEGNRTHIVNVEILVVTSLYKINRNK